MRADYIYASSYIRSQETKLLTAEQFRNMTESKNIDDICKVLQDAGYGTEGNVLTPENYQEVLKTTEESIFVELRELGKNNRAFDIFSYPADYHNIKVLLKAESLGVDRSELLLGNGTIAAEDMAKYINERNKLMLTENMGLAIDEALDVHARTKDPQAIDFICDKYCFLDVLEAAEDSKSDYVMDYVKLWIDTINLKMYVRVKKMGQPRQYFSNIFVPGGNVDEQTFLDGYDEDLKQNAERFQVYEIYRAMSEGGEAIVNNGTFTLLEKICDDVLMEHVKNAKTVTFGVEPLIAFLFSRQSEIRGIRILMAGKLANMEPEVIRERLRETYE